VVEQGDDWVYLEAGYFKNRSAQSGRADWHRYSPTQKCRFDCDNAPTLAAAMTKLANLWQAGRPVLASIRAETKGDLKGPDTWVPGVRGWAEAVGLPAPDIDDVRKQQGSPRPDWRDQLLAELRSGPAGVKRWNQRGIFLHDMIDDFKGADLHGVDLTGVSFYE